MAENNKSNFGYSMRSLFPNQHFQQDELEKQIEEAKSILIQLQSDEAFRQANLQILKIMDSRIQESSQKYQGILTDEATLEEDKQRLVDLETEIGALETEMTASGTASAAAASNVEEPAYEAASAAQPRFEEPASAGEDPASGVSATEPKNEEAAGMKDASSPLPRGATSLMTDPSAPSPSPSGPLPTASDSTAPLEPVPAQSLAAPLAPIPAPAPELAGEGAGSSSLRRFKPLPATPPPTPPSLSSQSGYEPPLHSALEVAGEGAGSLNTPLERLRKSVGPLLPPNELSSEVDPSSSSQSGYEASSPP